MSEQYRRFPQVLLLGNGLNRVVQSDGWGDLLARIKRNPKICINDDTYSSLPYPLLAVLATNDQVDQAIKENINLFYGASDDAMEELRPCLQQLLGMGFDDILTTNYSYELERAADQSVTREGSNCKKWMRHTEEIISAERKYLLHTYNAVSYRGLNNRVWHIHGEIRKPDSVILGHYYYGKLFSKYQELLNQRGNRQFVLEQQGKPPIMKSWLDAFLLGDVYVLGFGYDFSEFDLWWLLNRKKREQASHGTLYFYSPAAGNELKFALLESYGAKIECLGFWQQNPDYKAFYQQAIADIRSRVKSVGRADRK